MKQILFLLVVITLTSCHKKYESEYVVEKDMVVGIDPWNADYENGGTLPTGTPSAKLTTTKWVLTKIVTAFATEYPNDTIEFIDNSHYQLNGNAARKYTYANIPSSTNKSLTLYYFYPFGGSHYAAQIGETAIDDGEINNAQFTDIQNSNTSTIRAWFTRIQ